MAIRELKQAALDVLAERQRQIEAEGWHADHDDAHGNGTLAIAAAAYALQSVATAMPERTLLRELATEAFRCTGWGWQWWKPKDRRRDLIRAGALILAEIERLDRATAPPPAAAQPTPTTGEKE